MSTLIGFSYDPALARPAADMGLDDPWDKLRTLYAARAPEFLAEELPGLDPARARFVRHHVAHAASAGLAAASAGVRRAGLRRPRRAGLLPGGRYSDGQLEILATQPLPHSLGLLYEDVTAHLGFLRSSDEYKVMALASYGKPRFLDQIRGAGQATVRRRLPHRPGGLGRAGPGPAARRRADRCARRPGRQRAAPAGGSAAGPGRLAARPHRRPGAGHGRRRRAELRGQHPVLHERGPFEEVWVQPAAGDAGTALGAALHDRRGQGRGGLADDRCRAGPRLQRRRARGGAAHGRGCRSSARRISPAPWPTCWPTTASWPGSRAAASTGPAPSGTGRCWPTRAGGPTWTGSTTSRAGSSSGRSRPMVLADRAAEIFSRGPLPSPYMLFVHDVAPDWRDRIPAVVHVDGTARVQTVDPATQPLVAAHAGRLRGADRAAGGGQHQPQHRRAGRWWTTSAMRWSASAPRRWTRWPSARSWSGAGDFGRTVISYSVVIPTIGRPCLRDCLAALGAASGPAPEQVVVVDDRPARSRPLDGRSRPVGRCRCAS